MRKPKPIMLNSKNKTTKTTKLHEGKAAIFILLTTQTYQKTAKPFKRLKKSLSTEKSSILLVVVK